MSTELFLAHKAIGELKARYCRLMDTKQWEDWALLFCEDILMDCSDDVPPELGDAITRGRKTVVAQVRHFVGDAITVHQVHYPEIELTSETTATGLWAMSDVVVWPEGVEPPVAGVRSLHGYGHYHETYQLTDDVWQIQSLKLTRLLVDAKP